MIEQERREVVHAVDHLDGAGCDRLDARHDLPGGRGVGDAEHERECHRRAVRIKAVPAAYQTCTDVVTQSGAPPVQVSEEAVQFTIFMRAGWRDPSDAAGLADVGGHVTSALRLEPPRLDRGQILRPRLLEVLAQRWDRRATLVVAGAGFGKSTLLAQAVAENRLAPRGVDLWLSLTPADADAPTLLAALAAAFASGPDPVDAALDAVVSSLISLPPGTCLVLDDVHAVAPGSPGHAVLGRLVEALPLQCSLLLGSRLPPDLPLADWTVKGLVEVLEERHLAYNDDELAELATAKGRSPEELAGVGGWPALVELALAAGRGGSDSYLRQVVLGRLTDRQQRWLGALDAIGGGDVELAAASLGDDPASLDGAARTEFGALALVPAMQILAGGGFQPHALWHDTLQALNDAAARDDIGRRAAAELMRRGDHDRALDLFARCHDLDGMCAVVVDSCTSDTWRYPLHTLQRWRDQFPATAAGRPEAKLLDALTGREGATFDDGTVAALLESAAAFRERGDVGAEVSALAELAFVAREQGNTEAFDTVAVRLFELMAQGRTEIAGFIALLHATLAEAADDDAGTVAALADVDRLPLSRQWRSRAHWLISHSTVMLGRPAEAIIDAERSYAVAEDDFLGARYLAAYARWWCGVDGTVIDSLPFIGDEPYRTPFDSVYGGGIFAGLHAFAGDTDTAARSLAIAAEAAGLRGESGMFARPEYVGILRCSQAAIEVANGDDVAAAATVRPFFEQHPLSTPVGRRVARRAPALAYVLVPGVRAELDAAPLGPVHDVVRSIGRWFVDLRDGRVAPPPDDWRAHLLTALPLRWAVEAAARTAAVDLDLGVTVLDRLVDLRPSLVRSLLRRCDEAGGDGAVGSGARRLLAAVPIRPDDPVRLSLFGPMTVWHGGAGSTLADPALADARSLIALLAASGPTDVDEVSAMLWPAAGPDGGRERLAAAVATARDVLEPARLANDAPFVLRREGAELALAPPPWLETDLATFHLAVAAAADAHRSGAHSAELAHLEHAVAQVGGRPLIDITSLGWAAPLVDATVAAIVRAGQRAAALRFAKGDHVPARRHTELVLDLDPSNESCHQILVASFADEGRSAAALDAFTRWQSSRAGLGLERSPEMRMLARRLGLADEPTAVVGAADVAPGLPATADLAVQVLGRFVPAIGDREAAIAGGKPQELVKLLAVMGRPLPEDAVCDALWPEVDVDVGRRRLRNVVARVRAAGPFLERGDGLLGLTGVVEVDLHRFEALAAEALRSRVPIEEALDAYGGELLPGDRFVEWTAVPRERVRVLVVQLLEMAVDVAARRDDVGAAVHAISRLLDVDPYAEHWAARAATLLTDAGRMSAAAQWTERAARIRAELGL